MPETTRPPEKTDLRVIKTHRTIRNALIELLAEMPYDKIAVQDILDRALVNRSTFYKHYSGKSDLAGRMIKDFKAEYGALLAQRLATRDLQAMLPGASAILFEQRRTILALWKIETPRHHLYQDMYEMIRQNYLKLASARQLEGNLDFQAHMLANVVLQSIRYYFGQDKPIPFAQLWRDMQTMARAVQSP